MRWSSFSAQAVVYHEQPLRSIFIIIITIIDKIHAYGYTFSKSILKIKYYEKYT